MRRSLVQKSKRKKAPCLKMDSEFSIDPKVECDAPTFVDFTNLTSQYDDNADEWFDMHDDFAMSEGSMASPTEICPLDEVKAESIAASVVADDDFTKSEAPHEGMASPTEICPPCGVKTENIAASFAESPEGMASPTDIYLLGRVKTETEIPSESMASLTVICPPGGVKTEDIAATVMTAFNNAKLKNKRAAAVKARGSISEMSRSRHVNGLPSENLPSEVKKQVKSTEELQMEEIKRLQLEAKRKLKNSRRSFQRLAKGPKPLKVIKGSKPTTETKEFNFSIVGERNRSGTRTGAQYAESIHPSTFASTLRIRHPSDPPGMAPKKPPTPELTTRPKPFKFALDKRPGLRSNSINSSRDLPTAEFILKYQTSTPPRFRRGPTNTKTPAAVEGGEGYDFGSHITLPKTPNLVTKTRKRPVVYKSAAEVEEEEAAKMKQYQFKANPLNPDLMNKAGLYGVPRKRTNPNLTRPVSPQLATKKLALTRKAQEEEEPDYEEGDRKFVAQPMPNFSEIKGVPTKRPRPITKPDTPTVSKRQRLNDTTITTDEEEAESHMIKANPLPNFDKVFAPQYPQRMVMPQPFSFEERDKNKATRETLVQKILREENKSVSFKAKPLPSSTFQPPVIPKVAPSLTQSKPFNLHTEIRGEQHAQKWKEHVEKQFHQEKQDAANFKAKDASIVYAKPFAPEKSTKPLTHVENVVLRSELRSSQRAKYEADKQERTNFLEVENLQRRALREARETKEIAGYRKSLVHKAQPIGQYRRVVIKPSDRPVTQPISPHFEVDRALMKYRTKE